MADAPLGEQAKLAVYPRRYRWAASAAGLAVGPLIVWLTGLPIVYGCGFGFLVRRHRVLAGRAPGG